MSNSNSNLSHKQESFCMAYIETGNATGSYKKAYAASKMSDNAIGVEAKRLLDNPKVTLRLEQLRAPIIERHKITVDDLLAELDENRKAALSAETVQASAATAATMGKAKLLGYLVEKIEKGNVGDFERLTNDELDRKLADAERALGLANAAIATASTSSREATQNKDQ